jgi:hypothetical protein
MNNRPSKCGAWLAPAFAALAFVATVPAASRVSPASGALRCEESAANENLAAPLSPLASAGATVHYSAPLSKSTPCKT